jgi:UTP--glucose-1-phosphate uridylyltransferase
LGGAVEKPGIEDAPSRLGLVGRYLFTPEVFALLDKTQPGSGGEIQLTDAIDGLGKAGRLRGYVAAVNLLDVGTPLGLLEASVVLGADQFGEEFTTWLGGRPGS